MAAALNNPEGDPAKAETFERLAAIHFSHPILSVFSDPDARYFSTARFYRRFPLQFEEDRGGTVTLAEFSTGKAALVEGRFGAGIVLLAAFPASAKWSNLPMKPEFVPLVLRMVSHVEQSLALDAPAVVAPAAAAEVSVAAQWGNVSGTVTDPAGKPTPLDFQRSGSRLLAAYEDTKAKGYYAVEAKGQSSAQDTHAGTAFAVNLAPEESDLETVDEARLREWFPNANFTFLDFSAQAQPLNSNMGEQKEIWRPLLLLTFLVIGIEFFLATLSGQRALDAPSTIERVRAAATGAWVGKMTGAGEEE